VVIEPRPITFSEQWADTVFDGVPLSECVVQVFVGRCQECGRRAERQHDGSNLVNVVPVDGTLYGDTFCVDCLDEEDVEGLIFYVPPAA
jgi:hypothetical protein